MILPFKDIESVGKEKGYTNFGYSGIVILIKGHEEMFFEFSKNVARDDFALTMIHMLDTLDPTLDSKLLDGEGKTGTDVAKAEHESLEKARSNSKQLSASHDKLAVLNDKGMSTPTGSVRRLLTEPSIRPQAHHVRRYRGFNTRFPAQCLP